MIPRGNARLYGAPAGQGALSESARPCLHETIEKQTIPRELILCRFEYALYGTAVQLVSEAKLLKPNKFS